MNERLNEKENGKACEVIAMKPDKIGSFARFKRLRDGPTDRQTDRPTNGQT